jgi:hypothetical protein
MLASDKEFHMRINRVAILLPSETSRIRLEGRYVLPLFQTKWVSEDGSMQAKIIPTPKEMIGKEVTEVNPTDELIRLAVEFGKAKFRTVYPTDDQFFAAMEKCAVDSLPIDAATIPEPDTKASMIHEIVTLDVPGVDAEVAAKVLDAGYNMVNMQSADPAAMAGKTGLAKALCSLLIKATREN